MNIMEQVEKLKNDMSQLIINLENTDSKNIDLNQLRDLRNYSRNYTADLDEIIYNLVNNKAPKSNSF